MNRFSRFLAPVGVAFLALSTQVHAALPAAVTTAVENAETDMTELITTLIGAGAVLWVLNIIYRRFAIR